ncbi:hypothetical protein MMC32_000366, partial [Xylographa parallela]|nr:hypothetical protein [Xylographa parallela]
MQPMLLLGAGLLSLLSLTSAQDITSSVSPAQASKISADIASYLSTVTTQANWVSAQSVLSTAIPSSDLSDGVPAYISQ